MHHIILGAARQGDITDLIIALVIAAGVAGYYVYRKSRKKAARDMRAAASVPAGYVRIVYHTYSGFLVFVIQRRREVVTTPAEARRLLGEALRHNLTWGMFAYGLLFVPIVSWFEYRGQMKKVTLAGQRGFQVTRGAGR